jgi:hypothetical protein
MIAAWSAAWWAGDAAVCLLQTGCDYAVGIGLVSNLPSGAGAAAAAAVAAVFHFDPRCDLFRRHKVDGERLAVALVGPDAVVER